MIYKERNIKKLESLLELELNNKKIGARTNKNCN